VRLIYIWIRLLKACQRVGHKINKGNRMTTKFDEESAVEEVGDEEWKFFLLVEERKQNLHDNSKAHWNNRNLFAEGNSDITCSILEQWEVFLNDEVSLIRGQQQITHKTYNCLSNSLWKNKIDDVRDNGAERNLIVMLKISIIQRLSPLVNWLISDCLSNCLNDLIQSLIPRFFTQLM